MTRLTLLRSAVSAVMLLCSACGRESAPAPTEPITVQLAIRGMHCGGCVEAMTAEAREVDGVESIDVSLEQRAATLRVRDETTTEQVVRAIEALGYRVTRVPTPGVGLDSPPTPEVPPSDGD